MQMTSSLWGMEKYYNIRHQSLFDDIRLPEEIDKTTLVNTILVEAGDFEILYSNGDFLKLAITTWFERKYNMLDRWIKAISIDYKPLENYNRTEIWTDTSEGTTTTNGSKNSTINTSGTDTLDGTTASLGSKNSKTNNSGSNTGTDANNETISTTTSSSNSIGAQTNSDETKVSAFNTATYSPSQKVDNSIGARTDTVSNTGENTTVATITKSSSYTDESTIVDSTTDNSTIKNTNTHTGESTITDTVSDNGTSSNSSEHTGNISGNIGVTTSQQMLEAELQLWGKVDIYHDTAELFVQDFCIMLY